MAKEIAFSPQKAVESILYIASRLARPTIHEVLKIRYFADKLHLAEYGFLASGDEYVAMQYGPVASNTYNLLKAARGDQSGWLHPSFLAITQDVVQVTQDHCVKCLRAPDMSQLSAADIGCLDEAIARYGHMDFGERTQLSHDSAWKKAWKAASEDDVGQGPMSVNEIAETLENAAEILDHLHT
jgi:uncharacterized phage-associated protein